MISHKSVERFYVHFYMWYVRNPEVALYNTEVSRGTYITQRITQRCRGTYTVAWYAHRGARAIIIVRQYVLSPFECSFPIFVVFLISTMMFVAAQVGPFMGSVGAFLLFRFVTNAADVRFKIFI